MGFFDFLANMKGPEFLVLYFVWFLLLFGAVFLLRRWGFDTPRTTRIGVLLFEALGIARFAIGSAQGMHIWTIMFVMMALGPFAFWVRGGDSNGGGFHFDMGGGCGGDGGCGGGGCGGCGG